jgi:hypothetical protein
MAVTGNFRSMVLHMFTGVQRVPSAATGAGAAARLKHDWKAKRLARQGLARPARGSFAGEGYTPRAIRINVKGKGLREKEFARI